MELVAEGRKAIGAAVDDSAQAICSKMHSGFTLEGKSNERLKIYFPGDYCRLKRHVILNYEIFFDFSSDFSPIYREGSKKREEEKQVSRPQQLVFFYF